MIFVIGIATFFSTLLGGLFALSFKDKLHLIIGFSAGTIIGVAFFNLLPEAIALADGFFTVQFIASIIAVGFVAYMILDRIVLLHSHHDNADECDNCKNKRGILGAGSLSFHSFLDGAAIGFAFNASSAVGIIVAMAVLTHKFSDGINTVSIILKNLGQKKEALRWLIVNAIAPILGILSTFLFSLPESSLGIFLALFCGFFLYIGASDLLPESHHSHPTKWTTIATIIGVVVIYGVIQLISL